MFVLSTVHCQHNDDFFVRHYFISSSYFGFLGWLDPWLINFSVIAHHRIMRNILVAVSYGWVSIRRIKT